MTAETYLSFVAPALLLALGVAMTAVLVRIQQEARKRLQPVRVRSRRPGA